MKPAMSYLALDFTFAKNEYEITQSPQAYFYMKFYAVKLIAGEY